MRPSLLTFFVLCEICYGFLPLHQRTNKKNFRLTKELEAAKAEQKESPEYVDKIPASLPTLKNKFYLLRHGQSTSNVAGRISSARSLAGSSKHGLTKLGYKQGKDSAKSLIKLLTADGNLKNNGRIVFYSSPFARAKQTASACLAGLDNLENEVKELGLSVDKNIIIKDGLMERFFGRLDGEKLGTYNYVWPLDMFNPTHNAFDVESVAEVAGRIRDTILEIDSSEFVREGNNIIVLVSHADVLQITQVYAAGLPNIGAFSQYRFQNGEIRFMSSEINSLPEAKPLLPL